MFVWLYLFFGGWCAYLDLRTRYIPPWLLVPFAAMIVIRCSISWSLVFCALSVVLYFLFPDAIGSADIAAFWFLSLYFGNGFFIVLLAACMLGILWGTFSDTLIPFVTCLYFAGMPLAAGFINF